MDSAGYPSGLASSSHGSSTWGELGWEEEFEEWYYGDDATDCSAESLESPLDWELDLYDFSSGPNFDVTAATGVHLNHDCNVQSPHLRASEKESSVKSQVEKNSQEVTLPPGINKKPVKDQTRSGDSHSSSTQRGCQKETLVDIASHGQREDSTKAGTSHQQLPKNNTTQTIPISSKKAIGPFDTIFEAIHLLEQFNGLAAAILDDDTADAGSGVL